MSSCLQLCARKLRERITADGSREFLARLIGLPEELLDLVCDNRKTCLDLVRRREDLLGRVSLAMLRLGTLTSDAVDVFRNVVCLDVLRICSKDRMVMPGVTKLRLSTPNYKNATWMRVSAMFPNLTHYESCRNENQSFKFTKSWVSGAVFPRLTCIKIRTRIIFVEFTARPVPRDLVRVKLDITARCGINSMVFRMMNPATIQSMRVSPITQSPDAAWWKAMRILRKVHIQNMCTPFSALMRSDCSPLQTRSLSVVAMLCDAPVRAIFEFAVQERRTLRVVVCDLHMFMTSMGSTCHAGRDVAQRIFTDSPQLQIVMVTVHDYYTTCATRFCFFVSSADNIAWVRRKAKTNNYEFYAADGARNIYPTQLPALNKQQR